MKMMAGPSTTGRIPAVLPLLPASRGMHDDKNNNNNTMVMTPSRTVIWETNTRLFRHADPGALGPQSRFLIFVRFAEVTQ